MRLGVMVKWQGLRLYWHLGEKETWMKYVIAKVYTCLAKWHLEDETDWCLSYRGYSR